MHQVPAMIRRYAIADDRDDDAHARGNDSAAQPNARPKRPGKARKPSKGRGLAGRQRGSFLMTLRTWPDW